MHTTIEGHYDGQHVIPDAPIPAGIPVNARVRIVFENVISLSATSSLATIARLAEEGKMPPDFSEQHEHYIKGLPR